MAHFKFIMLLLLVSAIAGCNKLATLKVHVTRNVNGVEQPAPNVLVMAQNLPDCKDIEGENTNENGVAVFDLKNGSYRLAAQQLDSTGMPNGTEAWGGVQLKKGQSEEVTLLLP